MASASWPAGVSLMKSASAVCMKWSVAVDAVEGVDSTRKSPGATRTAPAQRRRPRSRGVLADDHFQALSPRLITGVVHPAQQLTRRFRRQRPAEKEALRVLAVLLLQEGELREILDPLGSHVDTQRARHGDDGRGD